MSTAFKNLQTPPQRKPLRRPKSSPVNDREHDITLPIPFVLDYITLETPVTVQARLVGPKNAPVVLALGGISANRNVSDSPDGSAGWWTDLVGAGRTVNTQQYQVLSFDFFPGDGDINVPVKITPTDQARIAHVICDALGIEKLHAFIGASYGGMVALGFGRLFPERVDQLIVLCAAHRPHPLGTGWRSIQRKIVRFGLETGQPDRALSLARELGMTTYRTAGEFRNRFSTTPDAEQRFEVEEYLETRGEDFIGRMSPQRYLTLSESIDLHDVNPTEIAVPTTLVGFTHDQLVCIDEVHALAQQLQKTRGCYEHGSIYGHDAFLKEGEFLSRIIAGALNTPVRAI